VYILPHSRYDTTNMSEETTPTTIDATAVQKAAAIFCQPPATDTAQPPPDTTTAVTAAKPALTPDEVDLLQSLIQQAGQAEQLQATADGIAGVGVSRLDGPSRIRVTATVLDRARGKNWLDLAERGDNYAIIHALAMRDKAVLKLFEQAEVSFRTVLGAALEAKAARRAAKPLKKYVTGRVGKDRDGVLRHPDTNELLEVEPDNGKMLELMLQKTHPAYKQQAPDADKGGSGRPIVYNIAFIGGPAASAAIPKAQEAIEATFSEVSGGNRAENSPFG
jgi:hypothetical protein